MTFLPILNVFIWHLGTDMKKAFKVFPSEAAPLFFNSKILNIFKDHSKRTLKN